MKIFVVTADIELTHKPAWLDNFRSRYDDAYPYHVTLKQPCNIEDSQVAEIKNKLDDLFSNIKVPDHAIRLTFDKLSISINEPEDSCIMIIAAYNEQINELQKQVVAALSEYKHYYKPESQAYEEQFQPHITIARDLNAQRCNEAEKALKQDYACEGKVTKVILTVVNNYGPTEAGSPTNQTVYNL